MNQKNDPTCSHDWKDDRSQEKIHEYDKNVPTVINSIDDHIVVLETKNDTSEITRLASIVFKVGTEMASQLSEPLLCMDPPNLNKGKTQNSTELQKNPKDSLEDETIKTIKPAPSLSNVQSENIYQTLKFKIPNEVDTKVIDSEINNEEYAPPPPENPRRTGLSGEDEISKTNRNVTSTSSEEIQSVEIFSRHLDIQVGIGDEIFTNNRVLPTIPSPLIEVPLQIKSLNEIDATETNKQASTLSEIENKESNSPEPSLKIIPSTEVGTPKKTHQGPNITNIEIENVEKECKSLNLSYRMKPLTENEAPKTFRLASTLSNIQLENAEYPLKTLLLKNKSSIAMHTTATQLQMLSNLPSPMSINMPPNQPQSLFLQALSKLNESSISFAVNALSKRPDSSLSRALTIANRSKSPELSPPLSLGSAPPSYSFVLRQMAVRRRPRMLGTFIPSPSFIQQAPPPTYTAAYDIYLDNLPPPPTQVYNFGFAPMLVVCPDCGFTGMTMVTSKITICTHLCAVILCIMCCWVCVPLPYVMRSCKDVYHYCRNCRTFLGSYCPTNPEAVTIR